MVLGVYDRAYILGITPITPIHMGVGRAGGVVDLPVQRDGLEHPTIYASSLKGSFKSFFWQGKGEMARCLFGPEPGDGDEKYASPVSFMDAVLAFIPVREASGGIVFATSPLALGRVLDYVLVAESAGMNGNLSGKLESFMENVSGVGDGEVLLAEGGNGTVFIGGQEFKAVKCGGCDWGVLKWLTGFTSNALSGFRERVAVFSEKDYRTIVERALIRLTRVRLDKKKKTVEGGALWTEEYVPQGTVFVSTVLCSGVRAKGVKFCGDGKFEEYLKSLLGTKYLVIGGKESTGKGVVKLSWYRGA